MRVMFWVTVVFFALMPVNYLLLVGAKLVHNETFGTEDVIGLGVAVFGFVAATVTYRNHRPRAPSDRRKPAPKELE